MMSEELKTSFANELAKPLYEDIVRPIAEGAVRPTASAVQTAARAVNAALAPVRMMVLGVEALEQWVNESVAPKMRSMPRSPDPRVAVPILNGVRLCAGSDSLQEIYAELLAASMDPEFAERVHPGFEATLRQMSSSDVRILQILHASESWPVVNPVIRHLGVVRGQGSARPVVAGETDASLRFAFPSLMETHGERIPGGIDSLVRLGILALGNELLDATDDDYRKLASEPVVVAAATALMASHGSQNSAIEYRRESVTTTHYGKGLLAATSYSKTGGTAMT